MDKVYLVVGSTGEFSDWTTWVVVAYPDKEMAELHRDLANEKTKGSGDIPYENKDEFIEKFYLDDTFQLRSVDTTYTVQEVEIVRHVDEYIEKFTKQ